MFFARPFDTSTCSVQAALALPLRLRWRSSFVYAALPLRLRCAPPSTTLALRSGQGSGSAQGSFRMTKKWVILKELGQRPGRLKNLEILRVLRTLRMTENLWGIRMNTIDTATCGRPTLRHDLQSQDDARDAVDNTTKITTPRCLSSPSIWRGIMKSPNRIISTYPKNAPLVELPCTKPWNFSWNLLKKSTHWMYFCKKLIESGIIPLRKVFERTCNG
jgi:hypothetical protein